MSSTRSLSLVKHVDLDFPGNLSQEALLLADVDNDGSNELVAGNADGVLAVFKGKSSKPWRTCDNLGTITCVGAGDAFNLGRNSLVCTTAEGWCYVFDVGMQSVDQALSPVYSQQLAGNCKAVLLGDIDGDGLCELMTGHTDRTLCLYQWRSDHKEADQKGEDSILSEEHEKEKVNEKGRSVTGKQLGKSPKESPASYAGKHLPSGKDLNKHPSAMLSQSGAMKTDTTGPSSDQDKMGSKIRGCFVCISSWTVPYHIGSLVSIKVDDSQHVVVSQPGGTFVTILMPESKEGGEESESMSDGAKELPVLAVGSRNPSVRNPTLITSVTHKQLNRQSGTEEETSTLALCTQGDGTVKFLKGIRLIWSTYVDETCKLFALSKFDINGNGDEQVVACTLDGQTYIIDQRKNIVRFAFGENVRAFLAGSYAVNPGHNSPCLVYVTFSDRVVVHWDLVHVSNVPSSNLIDTMNSSFTECRDVVGSLGKMTDSGNVDHEMLRKLYSWCLYNGKA